MVVRARTVVLWMELNTNMDLMYPLRMVVTIALVSMDTLARVQKWDVRSWVMMDGTSRWDIPPEWDVYRQIECKFPPWECEALIFLIYSHLSNKLISSKFCSPPRLLIYLDQGRHRRGARAQAS